MTTERLRQAASPTTHAGCLVLLVAGVLLAPAETWAHQGRRLVVEVVNDQLRAQGVNTGPSDGAPATRPYPNAIHDHWGDVESLGIATASLPGFDVSPSAAAELVDHRLDLELLGVERWLSPPMMPAESIVPSLTPLAAGQQITIVGPAGQIDSDILGSLTLTDSIVPGGVADLDLFYEINTLPRNEIHVLRFIASATRLSGEPSTILPSRPIHVLLSPDGSTPQQRLHHASLFLERYLATVPEPSAGLLVVVALGLRAASRRF